MRNLGIIDVFANPSLLLLGTGKVGWDLGDQNVLKVIKSNFTISDCLVNIFQVVLRILLDNVVEVIIISEQSMDWVPEVQ